MLVARLVAGSLRKIEPLVTPVSSALYATFPVESAAMNRGMVSTLYEGTNPTGGMMMVG